MENKKLIAISAAVFIVIFALILIKVNQSPGQIPKEKQYFTEEPETWVEENVLTDDDTDVRINVMKATEQSTYVSGNKQEIYYAGESDAFFSSGYYEGEAFDLVYVDPAYYERSSYEDVTEEDYTLMKISPYLNPEDGVINGFIMAKRDNSGFVFYIFVDEDWKQKIGLTNILYGRDFNNVPALVSKTLSFNEIKPGIYMDIIDDYNSWYDEDPIRGGLIVGQLTKQAFADDDLNSTFMLLR